MPYKDPEKKKQYIKIYYKNNREYLLEYAKQYRETHKEKISKDQKDYYAANKSQLFKQRAEYISARLKTDICFKIATALRHRIRIAIKNNPKRGSAIEGLGCSIEFLKEYIESKFYRKMSWDNYGKIWVLDHIIPLWKFDLQNKAQFLEACYHTNLQPLTIEDHKKKTAKENRERAKLRRNESRIGESK